MAKSAQSEEVCDARLVGEGWSSREREQFAIEQDCGTPKTLATGDALGAATNRYLDLTVGGLASPIMSSLVVGLERAGPTGRPTS
jgi:hypothetical protein